MVFPKMYKPRHEYLHGSKPKGPKIQLPTPQDAMQINPPMQTFPTHASGQPSSSIKSHLPSNLHTTSLPYHPLRAGNKPSSSKTHAHTPETAPKPPIPSAPQTPESPPTRHPPAGPQRPNTDPTGAIARGVSVQRRGRTGVFAA